MLNQLIPSKTTFLAASLLIFATGCSEEDRSTIGALSDLADNLEALEESAPSTFSDNCVEPLSQFLDDNDDDAQPNMTSSQQTEAGVLLNVCVQEIQTEIDLTRQEYPNLEQLTECNKNLNASVANKPLVQSKINEFIGLPNNTNEESLAVALYFSGISLSMMTDGGTAALNRVSICVLEKVAPEQFKLEG